MTRLDPASRQLIIIGAGPAGLAAAHEAIHFGLRPVIVEASNKLGGLARTEEFEGNRFDVGPHRFFTLNAEVNAMFRKVCGDDLIRVDRLTRIYYKGRFFNYPLTPVNALFGVGIIAGTGIFASYALARIRSKIKPPDIKNFEDWVSDRFGRRLFATFFKTYTEKVWGIPCASISADWASQRIKGLGLGEAVRRALFGAGGRHVKSLVDVFHYPRLGAGQFYEKLADRVRSAGGVIMTDTTSTRVLHDGRRIYAVEVREDDGTTRRLSGDFFLSSAPLTAMLRQFDPPPPPDVQAATDALRYRHHLSVQLVLEGPSPFPDNWIYIHSPDVKMARVCSYANFSTAMAASHGLHPLTAEYFCFDDDVVWQLPDVELLALAQQELASMGLCRNGRWRGGYVIRSKQSYPVIEQGYERHIEVIKAWLNKYENFLPIGRSGMFKYNNQDHAIYTGVLAARTAAGHGPFDPWRVNIDATYHEGEEQEQGG